MRRAQKSVDNDCDGLQWLKRVDVNEVGRSNSTVTFTHDGDLYMLLQPSPDIGTATKRQSDGSYVSRLTVSSVTLSDAGLYVCVVTARYGLRSYRAAALAVYTGNGQCFIYLTQCIGDANNGTVDYVRKSDDILCHMWFHFD